MKPSYLEILERMQECRIISKKSQEEMGLQFAVTQSHYCKLENGSKIISYKSLESFKENGGDVCYLITGKSHYSGITDEYVRGRKTVTGKVETINLLVWLVKQGLDWCNQRNESLKDSWKYIQLMDLQDNMTIWKKIRIIENVTQLQMAECLDIDIKRYRNIEKLKVEPDAQILHSLYVEFGYSPMVIMDRNVFCMSEINKIWDEFPEDVRMMLKRYLDYNMQLILSNEEKDSGDFYD